MSLNSRTGSSMKKDEEMKMSSALQVIIVDDEKATLEAELELLATNEFQALGFTSANQALAHLKDNADRCLYVISDMKMPEIDGFGFREQVRAISKDIPFAFLSGAFTIELAKKAMECKVSAVLEKPISQQDLMQAIRPALEERRRALEEKSIIREIFVTETRQILEELEPLVLNLEENGHDASIVNDIFRLVHTIKGSSSFLENNSLPKYAHLFENLLSDLKNGRAEVNEAVVSVMLDALDVVKEMTAAIESCDQTPFDVDELGKIFNIGVRNSRSAQKGKADADGGRKVAKNTEKDFLRVPIRTLDEFMELSGEITIVRNVVNKLVKSLEKHYPSNKDLSLVSEMLEEMYKSQSRMVSNVLDMRKVPLFDVFRPFQRMVRDLCKSLDKEVKLKVYGEALRVDTSLGKVIGDCLVHIIRNSMDHGVEGEQERTKAGKSAEGRIDINCYESRDEVVIEVKDDGRGLNLDAIREKATERGLVTYEESKIMSEAQVMQLIFEPGFSTAQKVTDVSGRGVGMDMVKTSVDAIGGHIEVGTEKGQGSNFQLRLPIPKSVLIISVVLVRSAGKIFAFPQDRIEHLLQFDVSRRQDYIREMQQSRFLIRDGKLIPLVKLSSILQLPDVDSSTQCEANVVVVRDDRVHYAIEVDTILDSEEVVVKPLSNVLAGLTCYAGATLVGVGDVCVIVDYEGLAALSGIEKISVAEAQKSADQKSLLLATTERDYVLYRFPLNDTVYSSRCDSIYRLEHVATSDIQMSGNTRVIHYREKLMPLFDTSELMGLGGPIFDSVSPLPEIPVLVVAYNNSYYGFCVSEFVDVLFVTQEVDTLVRDRKGIDGNLFLSGQNYPVINLQDVMPAQFIVAQQITQHVAHHAEQQSEQVGRSGLGSVTKMENVSKKDAEEMVPSQDDGILWVV